ncbi:MAG: TetR family transcriptional regulator C-terminal domain-containing protein, partial [Bacteroidales bacterium]
VEYEALALRAELAKVIREHRDNPVEQLKGYVSMRLALMKELANFYSALSDEYLQHLEMINKVREKYQRKELATLQAIIHSGKNKGLFEIEDVHVASLAILAAMSGLENPLFLGLVDRDKVDERVEKVMQILLYGIIKRSR